MVKVKIMLLIESFGLSDKFVTFLETIFLYYSTSNNEVSEIYFFQ